MLGRGLCVVKATHPLSLARTACHFARAALPRPRARAAGAAAISPNTSYSCCAAGGRLRPRRRIKPTTRVTTGPSSGMLTSSGWSRAGIASDGTAATPSPASTSPSNAVTCCASYRLCGLPATPAKAWSISSRLPDALLTVMKSCAARSLQLTWRLRASGWSRRHAATKRSSSSGSNWMSASWLPMKLMPKSASLRDTAASTLVGAGVKDLDADLREALAVPHQHLRQVVVHGRRHAGHRDLAHPRRGDAFDAQQRRIELVEQALHLAQEIAADGSEADAPRRAVEQLHAERGLQLVDAPAERGLRDRHRIGGLAEVAQFGHRAEGLQVVEVEVDAPWLSIPLD